jgi:hypothetical protein
MLQTHKELKNPCGFYFTSKPEFDINLEIQIFHPKGDQPLAGIH